MKILVTGGGGFIGSALIKEIHLRHNVISLDHGRNYPYLKRMFKNKVSLKIGNIEDSRILNELTEGMDAVVHLAGVAGERLCLDNPRLALISNVYGTQKLLESANKNKVKKFIFGSSYWAYPTFKKNPMPLKEKQCPEVTDSFYGMLKLCSEDLIKMYCNLYVILRFSTVYGFGSGFGSQWRGIIGKYILNVFRGEPMILYGDGSQKIDFIHIDDVVKILTYFIEKEVQGNTVLNVGSGRPVSIFEIAHIIKKLAKENFKIKAKIKKIKAPLGKVWPDKWLSITKMERRNELSPTIDLINGIYDMMEKIYEAKEKNDPIRKTIFQSQ